MSKEAPKKLHMATLKFELPVLHRSHNSILSCFLLELLYKTLSLVLTFFIQEYHALCSYSPYPLPSLAAQWRLFSLFNDKDQC